MSVAFTLTTTRNLSAGLVDVRIRTLAEQLAEIHGPVVMAKEKKGIHLYMASPKCLEEDGEAEVSSRHLAVNAEKYLSLGPYLNSRRHDRAALCMKTGTKYAVSFLLRMKPINERGVLSREVPSKVTDAVKERRLVPDGKGNLIPDHPGDVTPLIDIVDPQHPALRYLLGRGYDPAALYAQFRCGWCTKERKESQATGPFYRRMSGGFRDTPQGRIVFYADVEGVQQGWQARILEVDEDGRRLTWHPYEERWVHTHDLVAGGKPVPVFPYDSKLLPFKPSKYKTGDGVERNGLLMGLDAAIASGHRTVIVVEGPLDAGRLGPPAVAKLGKYLSPEQALLLARHFKRVVFVADADKAGRESLEALPDVMDKLIPYTVAELPRADAKDPGELKHVEAMRWKMKLLKN